METKTAWAILARCPLTSLTESLDLSDLKRAALRASTVGKARQAPLSSSVARTVTAASGLRSGDSCVVTTARQQSSSSSRQYTQPSRSVQQELDDAASQFLQSSAVRSSQRLGDSSGSTESHTAAVQLEFLELQHAVLSGRVARTTASSVELLHRMDVATSQVKGLEGHFQKQAVAVAQHAEAAAKAHDMVLAMSEERMKKSSLMAACTHAVKTLVDFERIVARTLLSEFGEVVVAALANGNVRQNATTSIDSFYELEITCLLPRVCGSLLHVHWSALKRAVPISATYYDLRDSVLDECDEALAVLTASQDVDSGTEREKEQRAVWRRIQNVLREHERCSRNAAWSAQRLTIAAQQELV